MNSITAAANAAWGLWRRDAALLWPLFGVTQFLPLLLRLLAMPPLPRLAGEAAGLVDQLRVLSAYGRENLPAILLIVVLQALGRATLFSLYRAPARTLATAFGEALALFPRYLLIVLAVTLGTTFGLLLFLLPGFYLAGRWLLAGPAFVAAPERPSWGALAASWRLTRGHGLLLMALVALAELGRSLIERPFALGRASMAEAPLLDALLALGQATGGAAMLLALALFQVGLYRELSARVAGA